MIKRVFAWLAMTGVVLLMLTPLVWQSLNHFYPLPVQPQQGFSLNVVASNGEILRQFSDRTGTYRIATSTDQVADIYLETLLAYEDQHFFDHNGVEVTALVRALWQRATSGRIVSGGSTLTMQVARILFPIERSYWGKLVQIFRALQLEQTYTKNQILSLYLTYAPMGGNIDGVEAASQRYLGKSAKDLNISEAALLTVIPQRPSVYRPDRYPEHAFAARNKVLRRLVLQGKLNQYEYQLLATEKVLAGRVPVKRQIPLMARELKISSSGLHPMTALGEQDKHAKISTFIDPKLQSHLDSMIEQRFISLASELSVAILVMHNQTGNVIAYKGSLDMDNDRSYGHVDMTKAVRSPGSTLKPFVYAQALDDGLIHSESLMLDIPTQFGDYAPQNFNHRFQGEIGVAEALQRSKNIAPVYLLDRLKVSDFVQRMEVLGASLRLAGMNLTVTLGGGGSTLRELVMFYSSLNRGGVAIKPKLSPSDKSQQAQLMTPESAWIVKTMLEQIRPPDRARAKYSREIAWKTGTSFGFRDAWAIGTSADYTVGVWTGRPDGTPYVGQTGVTKAAPLLFDVFDLLPSDDIFINRPERVKTVTICWPSGLNHEFVKVEDCKRKRQALTIDGVTPRTLRRETSMQVIHQWPQELLSWKELHTESSRHLDIIAPQDGSHIYPYEGQQLQLKASSKHVRWYIDGAVSDDLVDMASLSGPHRIKACTQSTCSSVNITVY